ncbi:hypothetical protein Hanom_Chr04g00372961 [Helianthus anomalus]
MSFSSLRFGQFCDFHPKVWFSASGSKRFEILPFSSGSLTSSIFFHLVGYFRLFTYLLLFSKGILNTCTLC